MPFYGSTTGIHDDLKHTGSAKRDTAGGVAGLDGLGNLLAKFEGVKLARNTSNNIYIYERTSGEKVIYFNRVAPDDFEAYMRESGAWKHVQTESMKDTANGIAGLDANVKQDAEQHYSTSSATGGVGVDNPSYAVDGDVDTFAQISYDDTERWLKIDFGSIQQLLVFMKYEWETRNAGDDVLTIAYSTDDITYTTLNELGNINTVRMYHEMYMLYGRYVKFTTAGGLSGFENFARIYEVKAQLL
jgi:hypothetical protein